MLFLFCVALWFKLQGASSFKVFPCSLSWCFVIPFRIVITSLGEEGAGLCAARAFVCLFCTCWFLSFVSSSWCRGLAAVCDCGTPWTFLLTFFHCMMYLLSLDHVSKNQLSTNQNLLNTRGNSRNDRWTCIIPLDMYRLA